VVIRRKVEIEALQTIKRDESRERADAVGLEMDSKYG
jgi:hypothetical protein